MAIIKEIQEEEEQKESKTYDVFLSFRGIDTRLNFTDYLYEALVSENISTFLDEQEVETGEELKPELTRAIKGSRASIIVLSKNYASSSWCLDELVLILEQRKVSKHIVVPIFYHVEPTHVRKQESSFGEALFKHRQRMEAEKDEEKKRQIARKLESWTKALKEVADLKGKDVNGRLEKEFIEEIVKEISSRLDIHMKSKIPHLIGRIGFLYTIQSWLHGGSSDTTEILTIWGMAGIGKTSLAKHIYLLHRHEFERSSFVEDIERRGQQSSALLLLQKNLLGDILKKRKIEEDDVQNCTSKIETALLQKRAFVVLDGVDDFEQVHVLVGREGFHPGSKIIITTKDGSITDKALLHIKYPPKHTKLAVDGLCSTDSLKLFCWHAFGGFSPKEGYEEEAKRASKYCGGHPLALKVLGTSLCNEDADTWSHTITLLESREFQTTHVHEVLFKHRQRTKAEQDEKKKRQAIRKLESWTEALKEVDDLKGKDLNGRIEKEFIVEIVNEISIRLDIDMKNKNFGNESGTLTASSIQSSQQCRHFSFSEILSATKNFHESLVIGRGGFGNVYKGTILNGSSAVIAAIKRLGSSNQGAAEFWTEVEMLSNLRHSNLVSLFGYCNEKKEMILIYEYMPNGTLEDHLHKLGTPLSWLKRLKICIGAARGLHYLHTGTGIEFGVIHRDVKTSNILLHETWAAKMSDFGLSKIGPTNRSSTGVSTALKGTFGYLDPDYSATGKLTRKSDVYAFGVVLLEVLCRKRAVFNIDDQTLNLANWAQESIKEGNLKHIIDSDLRGEISSKCMKEFVRIAKKCLHSNPKDRSTMAEVLSSLESVLILQEKHNNTVPLAGRTIYVRMVNMLSFQTTVRTPPL